MKKIFIAMTIWISFLLAFSVVAEIWTLTGVTSQEASKTDIPVEAAGNDENIDLPDFALAQTGQELVYRKDIQASAFVGSFTGTPHHSQTQKRQTEARDKDFLSQPEYDPPVQLDGEGADLARSLSVLAFFAAQGETPRDVSEYAIGSYSFSGGEGGALYDRNKSRLVFGFMEISGFIFLVVTGVFFAGSLIFAAVSKSSELYILLSLTAASSLGLVSSSPLLQMMLSEIGFELVNHPVLSPTLIALIFSFWLMRTVSIKKGEAGRLISKWLLSAGAVLLIGIGLFNMHFIAAVYVATSAWGVFGVSLVFGLRSGNMESFLLRYAVGAFASIVTIVSRADLIGLPTALLVKSTWFALGIVFTTSLVCKIGHTFYKGLLERTKLQEKLVKASKQQIEQEKAAREDLLQKLALFIQSVRDELNTPLSTIAMRLEDAEDDMDPEEERNVRVVQKAITKLKRLSDTLRKFQRDNAQFSAAKVKKLDELMTEIQAPTTESKSTEEGTLPGKGESAS